MTGITEFACCIYIYFLYFCFSYISIITVNNEILHRAWLNEILAKITAPELPKDVPGAEALISRHKEYKTEIDARADSFDKFCAAGNALIDHGHFMAEEIADRIATLEARRKLLIQSWQTRATIYEHNYDLRVNMLLIYEILEVKGNRFIQ